MNQQKRTYTLPSDTVAQFEHAVKAGRRSRVIAGVLQDWLEAQKRERLRGEIIEGCQDMAEVYLKLEREYHPLEEEVHRVLAARPRKGRRRANPARSRRRI